MLLPPGGTSGDVTKRDGHDPPTTSAMTLEEFERWFIRGICRFHHSPHQGLGKLAPAKMWRKSCGAWLGCFPGIDPEHLTRRFLPWLECIVTTRGVQIEDRRYWRESFPTRIGRKIMIEVDGRTIQ